MAARIAVLALLCASSHAAPWVKFSDHDGIVVYKRKIPGSAIMAFRGETVIDAPLAKVLGALSDTPRKTEWTDRLVEARELRRTSEIERIQYDRTSAPWPIQDRDFVYQAVAEVDARERAVLIRMRSVSDPLMPETRKTVRAQILESLCELRAEGPAKTRIALQIQADLKGLLPAWVVNYANQQWPRRTLAGLRLQALKPDVASYPGIERLLAGGAP